MTYAEKLKINRPNVLCDKNGIPHICKKKVYGGKCIHDCRSCWEKEARNK